MKTARAAAGSVAAAAVDAAATAAVAEVAAAAGSEAGAAAAAGATATKGLARSRSRATLNADETGTTETWSPFLFPHPRRRWKILPKRRSQVPAWSLSLSVRAVRSGDVAPAGRVWVGGVGLSCEVRPMSSLFVLALTLTGKVKYIWLCMALTPIFMRRAGPANRRKAMVVTPPAPPPAESSPPQPQPLKSEIARPRRVRDSSHPGSDARADDREWKAADDGPAVYRPGTVGGDATEARPADRDAVESARRAASESLGKN